MPMAPPQLSSNTAPIMALVGAEIFSLMAFVGVCEARAKDIALCESRCLLRCRRLPWRASRPPPISWTPAGGMAPVPAEAALTAASWSPWCGTCRRATGAGSSAVPAVMGRVSMIWQPDRSLPLLALGAWRENATPAAFGGWPR